MNVVLAEGAPRYNISQLQSQISERWNRLTPEQKIAATDPLLPLLIEQREKTQHAVHNSGLAALQDTTRSLEAIEQEVSSHLFVSLPTYTNSV